MPSPGRATKSPARGRSAVRRRRAGKRVASAFKSDLAARLRLDQRAIRARLQHRAALPDLVKALSTTLEPPEIAYIALERVASWIPAPSWAVVAADLSGQLTTVAERGTGGDLMRDVHRVVAWMLQAGEHFLTADLRRDPRVSSGSGGAVVALRLSCRDREVGAIVGVDPAASIRTPQLTPTVRTALEVLLEPIAAALDSAVLLKRAVALSVTDDLTRLYNSRYLNQVLRRETKRAARSGRPLSLVFVDLDGFKTVNDRYGHLSGSRALVEAGAIIRGGARETDIVARFGGDEFALILPDTGAAGAYAVAERIRERIERHGFLAGEGRRIALTASIGVATLPDVAQSADELVEAADSAMYHVKHRGKNGIQVSSVPADTLRSP